MYGWYENRKNRRVVRNANGTKENGTKGHKYTCGTKGQKQSCGTKGQWYESQDAKIIQKIFFKNLNKNKFKLKLKKK